MAYIGKEPASGIRNRFIFTATAGQTTFSGTDDHNRTLSYTDAEFTDVFLNGIKLDKSDYTATSGTSIVLDEAAAVDDIVEVIAFDTFSVFSGEFSQDLTVGGNVSVTGDLTVGTSQSLFWDASAESLGIGTTSPDRAIKIHKDNAYVWVADAAGGNVAFMGGSGENDGLLRLYEGSGHTAKVEIHSDADSYFNGGNVGIGNAVPSEILDIKSTSSAPTIRIHANTTSSPAPAIELQRGTNDTWGADNYTDFRIENSEGNLKFFGGDSGITSEYMRLENDKDLHVDGNVVAYSTTISDIRLKKDIAPIEDAVTKVQQLNGCTFTYLKDDRKSAGLIAQDVEKVLPSAVIEDEAVFHGEEGETYKTVQYDQVIGLLVEAVKELKAEIEELKDASSK